MKKEKIIWDYFEETVDYPKQIANEILPWNEMWCYISSTFLNGFINYVKPVGCYVVNRYTREDKDISDRNVSVCNKGKFGNWHKFKGTKKEFIDLIVSGEKEVHHTKLDSFEDDVIILTEIESEERGGDNRFMFFWYDMDVSGCCVGRFETTDSKEDVLKSVENWLSDEFLKNKNHESKHDDKNGFHKLPLSFLKGWIKF